MSGLLSGSKQCLMLLKSLIEGLKQRFPKELEDLCSYHGKTAFLHTLSHRYCLCYHPSVRIIRARLETVTLVLAEQGNVKLL